MLAVMRARISPSIEDQLHKNTMKRSVSIS
jgi:hypothetical protein